MKTDSRKKKAAPKKKKAASPGSERPVSAPARKPRVALEEGLSQNGRMRMGQVVSTKMANTIVVNVERRVAHPLYRKIVRRHKKLYAHDESGAAKAGDWVKIQETRPLSRLKCWRLVEIVRSAPEEGAV